jgi:hypothetical protein
MDYLQGIWYHLIEDTETNSFLARNRNKLTTLEINQRGGENPQRMGLRHGLTRPGYPYPESGRVGGVR